LIWSSGGVVIAIAAAWLSSSQSEFSRSKFSRENIVFAAIDMSLSSIDADKDNTKVVAELDYSGH
jgi:hypothetical protein